MYAPRAQGGHIRAARNRILMASSGNVAPHSKKCTGDPCGRPVGQGQALPLHHFSRFGDALSAEFAELAV